MQCCCSWHSQFLCARLWAATGIRTNAHTRVCTCIYTTKPPAHLHTFVSKNHKHTHIQIKFVLCTAWTARTGAARSQLAKTAIASVSAQRRRNHAADIDASVQTECTVRHGNKQAPRTGSGPFVQSMGPLCAKLKLFPSVKMDQNISRDFGTNPHNSVN